MSFASRIVSITLLGVIQQARANDLLQFYHQALAHDAVLQAATYQRDAAIEARPQALARLLPRVGANANAGREREGLQNTGATTSQAVACTLASAQQMQYCYTNAWTYGLTLSQPLWSAESYSQLKETSSLAAAAEANLLAAQQNLLLRVATTYFGILSARDRLTTNRLAREAFSALLTQIKARERIGISPRGDVEQAQSFYDGTEQSVIDAQNAVDDADLVMTEMVGPHAVDIAPLQETIPLATPDPYSVDAWVASARTDNFSVRAARLQAEAADYDIWVQRGKGLPTLNLNVSTARSWQDAAFGGRRSLDTVGVSFTWPLFQSGAVSSAVHQSRALSRQAWALHDAAQGDTERITRASYRGVVTGIARISAGERFVESARESVEASRKKVEFGSGSIFDLLNAQTNYYAARRAYSQTRYDYLTALLTLKQQAGRLSEHDLAAIDGLLVARGSQFHSG